VYERGVAHVGLFAVDLHAAGDSEHVDERTLVAGHPDGQRVDFCGHSLHRHQRVHNLARQLRHCGPGR